MEDKKKPIYKKWWFWLIIIVVIGIAGSSTNNTLPTSSSNTNSTNTAVDNTSTEPAKPKEQEPEEPKSSPKISLDEFNQIQTGMTYQQVVDIIGSEGTVLSETDIGEPQYKTTIYTWEGSGSLGANANITIQDGKVISKAQFGLK